MCSSEGEKLPVQLTQRKRIALIKLFTNLVKDRDTKETTHQVTQFRARNIGDRGFPELDRLTQRDRDCQDVLLSMDARERIL